MSSIRITGLATGIDTDKMIKELMQAERTRVDKVQQDRQILQWRQELYNSINKDFANFILNTKKEFGLNVTSSTGSIDSRSLSSLSWVKRAVSSNEAAIKATTTSKAADGRYDITVHRLADGVKGASSEDIGQALKNILSDLKPKTDEDGNVIKPDETFDLIINDKTITVNHDDTMSTIIKKINESDAGVQASYDASIGRFFIQTKNTGEGANLSFAGTEGLGKNFIDALKLNVTAGNKSYTYDTDKSIVDEEEAFIGTNALIDFNGATGIEQSSNQFTINGISLDIRQADPNSKITIQVDTDTDAVYDKIKGFVDQYNELIDKMGKLLGEKQYRDYRPLTAEQKESMKDKEIDLWEEKAKSGLLRNDSIISSTIQKLRSSLYNEVEGADGAFSALYELGITTERWVAGAVGGKLEIDEEKLKTAISSDVNSVLQVLFKEAGPLQDLDAQGNPVQGKGGVITRMYDIMIDGMKEVIYKAGPGEESSLFRNIRSNMLIDFVTKHGSISLLDKDIKDIDSRISDLNAMLLNKEDQYYRKFSVMEQFVQQMNNQGSWMLQQLGM